MKNKDFQDFLFKSAVMVMSCDGEIASSEIDELKNITENEIYLLGYEYEEPLQNLVADIKVNGKDAINKYLNEINLLSLSPKQELILVELLIRMIEADLIIQPNEIMFLQLVKAKLKTSEENLIMKFPKQVSYLLDTNQFGVSKEFTDEVRLN
jgi:uncharacterized tellurite resistance protein B-like protein